MGVIRIGKEETEAVEVEFILARKLIAISANVFFPTTILNIISFSTNYYKNDYFESIVGINLTSMLVLTALIVQVNDGLPDTSYLKMIDIWLFFNLLVPFIFIIIHTFIETLRNRDEEERVEIKSQKLFQNSMKDLQVTDNFESKRSKQINMCFYLANFVMPTIFVIFAMA